MKKFILALALAVSFLNPALSWANRASPFMGIYEILSQKDRSLNPPIFLFDADSLEVLWCRYAGGQPYPADLEQYRREPSIIAGFNNRNTLFFGFERGALILDGYIAIEGGDGERLELNRRPDGQYDMGVLEKGRITQYVLAAPKAIPRDGTCPSGSKSH